MRVLIGIHSSFHTHFGLLSTTNDKFFFDSLREMLSLFCLQLFGRRVKNEEQAEKYEN